MKATACLVVLGLVATQSCATAPPPQSLDSSAPLDSIAPVRTAYESAIRPIVPTVLPDKPGRQPSLLTSDWVLEALQSTHMTPGEAAQAESPWEKFSFSAGVLLVAMNSGVRFGPSGLGVSVNLEDLLGFDTGTTSARLEGSWRFTENRRHRVDISWIDLSRSGDATLKQDLDLGNNNIIPAGSGVSSELNLNLIKTDYSYSFFQDDRFDLAGAAGLYVAPMEFSLSASGFSTYSDSFSVTAPLPLLGLRMDFALTPEWYMRSDLNLFYLKVGDYTGSMHDITTAVEYKPWDNFAFGLGFNSFGLRVESDDSSSIPGVDFNGRVDFGFNGLMLYLKGLW